MESCLRRLPIVRILPPVESDMVAIRRGFREGERMALVKQACAVGWEGDECCIDGMGANMLFGLISRLRQSQQRKMRPDGSYAGCCHGRE